MHVLSLMILLAGVLKAVPVVISNEVSVGELSSNTEISIGRFDLSQLEAHNSDFLVKMDYEALAQEQIENPASEDFDFQCWFDSEITITGRQEGNIVFQVTSGRYEVINSYEHVPANTTSLLSFPDSRIFQRSIADVSAFAGGEIELFFQIRQTILGGTEELSVAKDYRNILLKPSLKFTSSLAPSPTPNLLLNAQINGPRDGLLNFLTRQGFIYKIFIATNMGGPVEILSIEGTGIEMTYTLSDLNIDTPTVIIWLKESPLSLN